MQFCTERFQVPSKVEFWGNLASFSPQAILKSGEGTLPQVFKPLNDLLASNLG
jgi:hypothetical protein